MFPSSYQTDVPLAEEGKCTSFVLLVFLLFSGNGAVAKEKLQAATKVNKSDLQKGLNVAITALFVFAETITIISLLK